MLQDLFWLQNRRHGIKEVFISNDIFVFLSQTKALVAIQVFQTFFIRLRKNLIYFEAVSSFIEDSESEVGDIGDLGDTTCRIDHFDSYFNHQSSGTGVDHLPGERENGPYFHKLNHLETPKNT